jgi:hypothetical protein
VDRLGRGEQPQARRFVSRPDIERAGDTVTLADARIDGDVNIVLEIRGTREPEFRL